MSVLPEGQPAAPGIAVLGAGTMGAGIALVALSAGLPTALVDVDELALNRARDVIRRRLARELADDVVAHRLMSLRLTTDLEAAASDASAVVEAVPEIAELKLDVFERLGRACGPTTLLATNTSTMSISRLATASGGSPRVIGMHFFNPVHRMALVEVVVGRATSQATVDDALSLAKALGKDPIMVEDRPGFVTSRLGLLLGNEAMRMVADGVASAGDIDKAMRLGYGHPMGPLELADLVGLDARLNNVRSMHAQSGLEQYRPPAILERLVAEGHLGKKSGNGFYAYAADGSRLGGSEEPA